MCSSIYLQCRIVSAFLVSFVHMYITALSNGNEGSLEAQGVLFRAGVSRKLGRDASPVAQDGDVVGIDAAVGLADTGKVDLANKVDNGRLFGVVGAALHLEFVDAVLVVTLCETKVSRTTATTTTMTGSNRT